MHYASTLTERCVPDRRIPNEGASNHRAWDMWTMRARFKMKSSARSKTSAAIRVAGGRGTRILALAVPILLLALPAWSGGIGGNFTYGVSDGEVEDTDDFFPDIQTSAKHYEVGVSYAGRTYSEGKKIGWRDGVRAVWCILKYNLRPRFMDR